MELKELKKVRVEFILYFDNLYKRRMKSGEISAVFAVSFQYATTLRKCADELS